MTKEEVKKLFRLLRASYPQKAEMYEDDGDVMCAWYVILRPYTYDQARRAVTETMKSVRGVINIGDVAVNLPPPVGSASNREDRFLECAFLMLSRWPRFREIYHAAGLQTWEEARNDGQTFAAWLQKRNETEPFRTILSAKTDAQARKIEDEWAKHKGITLPGIDEIGGHDDFIHDPAAAGF